jgi:hypothetical protein
LTSKLPSVIPVLEDELLYVVFFSAVQPSDSGASRHLRPWWHVDRLRRRLSRGPRSSTCTARCKAAMGAGWGDGVGLGLAYHLGFMVPPMKHGGFGDYFFCFLRFLRLTFWGWFLSQL